jgi:ribosome-binding factor A
MSNLRIPNASRKKRPLRIATEILRDLPAILRKQVALPQNVIVSVTDVEVTDDLSFARVFFSVIGEHEEQTAISIERLLNSKRNVVRHELAQRLVMRQHPEIRFVYDSTPARAARIEELLKQVRDSSPENNKDSA